MKKFRINLVYSKKKHIKKDGIIKRQVVPLYLVNQSQKLDTKIPRKEKEHVATIDWSFRNSFPLNAKKLFAIQKKNQRHLFPPSLPKSLLFRQITTFP